MKNIIKNVVLHDGKKKLNLDITEVVKNLSTVEEFSDFTVKKAAEKAAGTSFHLNEVFRAQIFRPFIQALKELDLVTETRMGRGFPLFTLKGDKGSVISALNGGTSIPTPEPVPVEAVKPEPVKAATEDNDNNSNSKRVAELIFKIYSPKGNLNKPKWWVSKATKFFGTLKEVLQAFHMMLSEDPTAEIIPVSQAVQLAGVQISNSAEFCERLKELGIDTTSNGPKGRKNIVVSEGLNDLLDKHVTHLSGLISYLKDNEAAVVKDLAEMLLEIENENSSSVKPPVVETVKEEPAPVAVAPQPAKEVRTTPRTRISRPSAEIVSKTFRLEDYINCLNDKQIFVLYQSALTSKVMAYRGKGSTQLDAIVETLMTDRGIDTSVAYLETILTTLLKGKCSDVKRLSGDIYTINFDIAKTLYPHLISRTYASQVTLTSYMDSEELMERYKIEENQIEVILSDGTKTAYSLILPALSSSELALSTLKREMRKGEKVVGGKGYVFERMLKTPYATLKEYQKVEKKLA